MTSDVGVHAVGTMAAACGATSEANVEYGIATLVCVFAWTVHLRSSRREFTASPRRRRSCSNVGCLLYHVWRKRSCYGERQRS